MKVLLVNGSPHETGCTRAALDECAKTLTEAGIETEVFWIGREPIRGCQSCGACSRLGRCVFQDRVNEFTAKAAEADGFIIGSPVYYAGINGSLKSLLDRAFYSAPAGFFAHKFGAAVVSARRAGTTASLVEIEKYFTISQMPIVSSRYWNMVHGFTPADVARDAEGLQVMRQLGRNMAWLLRLKEAGTAAGVPMPVNEPPAFTNFIR